MTRSKFLVLLCGSFCWIIFLIFLSIPFTLLLMSKCIVIGIAYIFRKDLHSVNTGDAAFTIGCSWKKSKLSVGLLCHVQGYLNLEQVQNRFTSCLLDPKDSNGDKPKYDKLFSCLVTFCGYVFRKILPSDAINLSNHIYERRLFPGESLETLIETWMEKSYAKLCPAWELIVVPINTSSGSGELIEDTVIAFKIHHVFADGYSLLHILDKLTGSRSPYLVKEANESVWKMISDALSMPINLRMLGGAGSPKTSPLKLDVAQTRWYYTFTTVDLAPIKEIRRKYDVHFATVILSLIVGAIRQFVLETKSEKDLPSHFAIADTLPCEKHPSQNDLLCNHWTLGIIKSPMKADDPLKRILETEKYFTEFHEAGLQKVAVNYLFPIAWLFPQIVAQKAMEKDSVGFNCGLTSLVGADNYEFLGKRITQIQPLLTLIDSHPFTVFSWFTFSHSNKLDITLAAAPDLFPNGQFFDRVASEYFHNEFRKLCNQCEIICSATS